MIRQIIMAQCGIQFNGAALKEMNIPLPAASFGNTDITAYFK